MEILTRKGEDLPEEVDPTKKEVRSALKFSIPIAIRCFYARSENLVLFQEKLISSIHMTCVLDTPHSKEKLGVCWSKLIYYQLLSTSIGNAGKGLERRS